MFTLALADDLEEVYSTIMHFLMNSSIIFSANDTVDTQCLIIKLKSGLTLIIWKECCYISNNFLNLSEKKLADNHLKTRNLVENWITCAIFIFVQINISNSVCWKLFYFETRKRSLWNGNPAI